MDSRPSPHPLADAHAAADGVRQRRSPDRPEDHLWGFPGVQDLLGVLDFIAQNGRVPLNTRKMDLAAALTIIANLETELERRKRSTIEAARAVDPITGMPGPTPLLSWSEIARALRLHGRQAAYQTGLRLRAVKGEPRTEAAVRRAARQRAEDTAAAAALSETIHRAVVALVAVPDLPAAAREWLDIAIDLIEPGEPAGPGLITAARKVVDDLAGYPVPEGCGELVAELAALLPRPNATR